MTLLELLQLMRKKWYLLVVFPLVLGIVAGVYCWGFMSNDYTSSVSLYVLSKTDDGTSTNLTNQDVTTSQQLANDIAVLAETNRVSEATANALGMDNLAGFDVSVSSESTNRVITLSVTGKRPETVAAVANQMAEEISDAAIEVMDLRAVNIFEQAQVPDSPSGPNRVMYTAVAVLAGLFIAIAIIVLLDLLDTTVKTNEEMEELFGLPVLGSMPAVKKGR